MGLHCALALIPWLGGLKPSTTTITVGLDMYGQNGLFADVLKRFPDTSFQFLLGNRENSMGFSIGLQREWRKGEVLTIGPNEPQPT